MQYRRLGRTGLQAGEIGLGTEYLVSQPQDEVNRIFSMAAERGANYVDVFWPQRTYRDVIARGIRPHRSRMILAGHLGVKEEHGQYARTRNVEDCREDFHDFLRRFQTDCVDIMMLHFVDEPDDLQEVLWGDFFELAGELKQQGKARSIGMSCHQIETGRAAAESGLVDVIMFSLNPAFDVLGHLSSQHSDQQRESRLEDLESDAAQMMKEQRREFYRLCAREDVALVAMKIFAAGWLFSAGSLNRVPTTAQCIQYALSQPAVATVVPGVRTLAECEDVLNFVDADEQARDYSAIIKDNQWDLSQQCMYCSHCQPCPEDIDIAAVIRTLDNARSGLTHRIRKDYRNIEVSAEACTQCGVCQQRCPFGVPVIERMEEAAGVFGR